MASKFKGEVELDLGGKTYVLRPSFEAIDAVETTLGKSAFDLLIGCRNLALKLAGHDETGPSITMGEMVRATHCLLHVGDDSASKPELEEWAALAREAGAHELLGSLSLCLQNMLTGGTEKNVAAPVEAEETASSTGDATRS